MVSRGGLRSTEHEGCVLRQPAPATTALHQPVTTRKCESPLVVTADQFAVAASSFAAISAAAVMCPMRHGQTVTRRRAFQDLSRALARSAGARRAVIARFRERVEGSRVRPLCGT